ncbi:MAG: Brp/Blh family beta-carotene 15,15'-dioxygenase [Pirellulales bacterium]
MTTTTADAAGRCAGIAFHGLPLAVLAILAATAAVTGPEWSAALAPLPWVVSLVCVGLPHGAADFAMSRQAWRGRPLVALWVAYAVIMAGMAACFALAPLPTLAGFVVLGCWHFGLADAELERPPPASWPDRALVAMCRGAATVAVPLIVWPEPTAAAVADVVRLVMPAKAAADASLISGGVRTLGLVLGGVGAAALAIAAARDLVRGGAGAAWRRRLIDLATLTALGSLTDPLFSVGASFLVWHAWRQMGPLAEVVAGGAPRSWREVAVAVAAIHASALPLLVPTWAAIAGAWWAWSPNHSSRDLALLSIGAYLVVTPPHELLGDLFGVAHAGKTAASERLVPHVEAGF